MDKADGSGHGFPAGPTTELRLTLNSPNKGAESELNNGSGGGASANAGSREEMVFVTADPLSELVWSPHKGLSLKCTDCNIGEKKTFLWGMVISPTQSITIGEGNDLGSSAGGNVNPSQIVQGFDCQVSGKATVIGSSSSTRSILPIFQNMEPTSKLESHGDVRDLTKDEKPVPYTNEEHDHLHKKGKRVIGLIDLQSSESCEIRRNTNSNNPEKASVQGLDSENTADISSRNVNNKRPNPAEVNTECNGSERDSSCDHFYGKRKVSNRNGENDSESTHRTFSSKQRELPDSPIRFLTSACNTHLVQVEGKNESTTAASNFCLERGGNTSVNDLGKSESDSVEFGVTSQPADDVTRNHCQIGELPEYDVILVEESPDTSKMPLDQRKGKEKVLSNGDANAGLLKDDDEGSHESVESCNNSTGLIVAGKRPWSFDQSLVTDSKRMKQVHEGEHWSSVQRHGSSFMNWISNMVKGSSKSDLKETTSLDLVVRPSNREVGSDDYHFMLQERNRQSINTNTGFGTVFKALYHSNVQETRVSIIDNQEQGSKDPEMAIGTCDNNNLPGTYGEENVKFDNEAGISPENQMVCRDGVGPSSLQSVPSANISTVPTDGKVNNFGSFFQNALTSPSEEKESHKHGLSASNHFINDIHPLGSPWITRFGPKVSSPVIESSQFDQNIDEAVEGSNDCIRVSPASEAHSDVRNKASQNYVVSTSGSFGLVRLNELTDHTVKPRADTTPPSQRLASVFARRLDALRHIMPSEVEGSSTHAVMTCIFCGIRGHKLQECSEITEAEFGALLKKLDFYDGAEESSLCLCIRCFELNHWAIACPNISPSKKSHSNGGFSLLGFKNLGKTLTDKVTYKEDTDYRASTVANEKFTDIVILDRSNSDLELTKGKQTITSSSTENLSKEYQMTAFYNFVNRQIPAIPRGTFDAVKKLRLSRTDIFKWKRSTMSAFPLEGFFIRLRLRKLEKELGCTGYYVARISSGSREKSSGSSKIPLSVKIGGFKCLVENRFVSNHEFLEDELLAWWCATLKVGGNLPSEKDLELKFNERKRFGF